ncbi:hypothetical protein LTR10_009896 [Elasticomyces elasticus]|nr:hypothetical protein LTR10_009896 [Elasticomyces elasticus]KAK4970186.1 hypothetical protein LTR42_008353 [Elasticomyces elasticus]
MKPILISLISVAATLVTALPTIGAVSDTMIVSIPHVDFKTTMQSAKDYGNAVKVNITDRDVSPGLPTCFGCGKAISSNMAWDAIRAYCQGVEAMLIAVDMPGTHTGVSSTIPYADGLVWLSVNARPVSGCGLQHVNGPMCYSNMLTSIYGCDSEGGDAFAGPKHGGITETDCLQHTITPNPNGSNGCPA